MHLGYLRHNHLQARCETWTVMGHHLGVEYRYPLLDRRIIEYMLRVPSELLCHTDQFRPVISAVLAPLYPAAVRFNTGKKDHLFAAWWQEMMKGLALSLMDELPLWRVNPVLNFVDFDRLQKAVDRYKSGHEADEMVIDDSKEGRLPEKGIEVNSDRQPVTSFGGRYGSDSHDKGCGDAHNKVLYKTVVNLYALHRFTIDWQ